MHSSWVRGLPAALKAHHYVELVCRVDVLQERGCAHSFCFAQLVASWGALSTDPPGTLTARALFRGDPRNASNDGLTVHYSSFSQSRLNQEARSVAGSLKGRARVLTCAACRRLATVAAADLSADQSLEFLQGSNLNSLKGIQRVLCFAFF